MLRFLIAKKNLAEKSLVFFSALALTVKIVNVFDVFRDHCSKCKTVKYIIK